MHTPLLYLIYRYVLMAVLRYILLQPCHLHIVHVHVHAPLFSGPEDLQCIWLCSVVHGGSYTKSAGRVPSLRVESSSTVSPVLWRHCSRRFVSGGLGEGATAYPMCYQRVWLDFHNGALPKTTVTLVKKCLKFWGFIYATSKNIK